MTLDVKPREQRVKNGNAQKLKEEEAYEKRNIDPIVKKIIADREKRDAKLIMEKAKIDANKNIKTGKVDKTPSDTIGL